MNCFPSGFLRSRLGWLMASLLLAASLPVAAQTCKEAQEIDPATRSAIESTARSVLAMSAAGDVNGLRVASIPSLAASFGGVEQAVSDNKAGLSGAATIRKTYLLELPGNAAVERAEFFCGIFGANGNTGNSAGFVLPNLAPGNYAVVIVDVNGAKGPTCCPRYSSNLAEAGSWPDTTPNRRSGRPRCGLVCAEGYGVQAERAASRRLVLFSGGQGSGGSCSVHEYSQVGQALRTGRAVEASDMPVDKQITITLGARTVKLLTAFPIVDDNQLALVVKYQAADVSNTDKPAWTTLHLSRTW